MENWLPVVGFENKYLVSNKGRIKRSTDDYIMGQFNQNAGYLKLTLSGNGKRRQATVHSLVAEAFIGPRPGKSDINHIDGNKKNNDLNNLEYVTRQQNVDHARAVLGYDNSGERHGLSKLKLDEVMEIKKLRKSGQTLTAIAKQFGCCFQTVSDIARGKRWAWVQCP